MRFRVLKEPENPSFESKRKLKMLPASPLNHTREARWRGRDLCVCLCVCVCVRVHVCMYVCV